MALFLLLSACGADSAEDAPAAPALPEPYNYIAAPIGVFDPFAALTDGNGTDRFITRHITGTLVEQDPEGPDRTLRFSGALAEGLPALSNDGLIWTFRIRGGLKFSDGTDIDAFSFVEALKAWLNPAKAYPSASRFWTAVKITGARAYATGEPGVSWEDVGIDAPNRLTLRFTLEEPAASPVGLMALNIMLPHPDILEAGDYDPEYAPVSGPYKVLRYLPGEGMTLEKNYYYPNAYKYADEVIELRFAEDAEPPGDVSVPWFVYLNPAYIGDSLRQALYYGIDRASAVESVKEVMGNLKPPLNLNLSPSASFIPRDARVGDPLKEAMPRYGDLPVSLGGGYDPALALEFFEQAYALNGGQRIDLTITCFSEEEFWGIMAIALRDQWMSLFGSGRFHLYLELKQTDEAYLAYKTGEYQMGFGSVGYNPMDIWASLACWSSGYPDKPDAFYNAEFDRLQYRCTLGDLMTDYAAKTAALAEMDKKLLGFMPAVPIFYN
jgi:ABC-type oligopeptide transport system substrate-binding subunit